MKTTMVISDALFHEAQALAARDGVTLRQLVEQGLRHVLHERRQPMRFKLRDASVGGEGLSSEARELGWDDIRDLANLRGDF